MSKTLSSEIGARFYSKRLFSSSILYRVNESYIYPGGDNENCNMEIMCSDLLLDVNKFVIIIMSPSACGIIE